MKFYKEILTSAVIVAGLTACSAPTSDEEVVQDTELSAAEDVTITEVELSGVPATVTRVISAERAGFEAEEVLKKVRGSRVYYDVEGRLPNGEEIEFDILMNGDVAEIVEIQTDLDFTELPGDVRQLALDETDDIEPVRIIESTQTDGSVIYEFFVDGKPKDPAFEIRVTDGQAELLSERWKH